MKGVFDVGVVVMLSGTPWILLIRGLCWKLDIETAVHQLRVLPRVLRR